jgi:hypothetical protein
MAEHLPQYFIGFVKIMEKALALVVLAAILVYGVETGLALAGMDWQMTETFYEVIYRVLLVVIGLELVRMLVVHDLSAVLELLAFVAARKVLKPDIQALDILLAIVAFVVLLAARKYLLDADREDPYRK